MGPWRLIERRGKGGNGQVWEVENTADGSRAALKVLHRQSPDKYERFKREVRTLRDLAGFGGVLPLLDSHVPDKADPADEAWYVMPLAKPIAESLREASLPTVVAAIAEIAVTLERLVSEGIHHRDIKPSNLYEYEGRFVVGDFGIVKRDEFEDEPLTQEGVYIGPAYFLPSEAFLYPDDCTPEAVDVYCLAMTLWVLATGHRYPPRSPIIEGDFYALTRRLSTPPSGTAELDAILAGATSTDPDLRPRLSAFVDQLQRWRSEVAVP